MRVGVIGGGAWDLVLAPVLGRATLRIWVKAVKIFRSWCCRNIFIFPFLVEFTMSPETLRVTKLFSTDSAFIILCPRVNSLMFTQMKSLSEILSTNCAMVRLFTSMDTVMSA